MSKTRRDKIKLVVSGFSTMAEIENLHQTETNAAGHASNWQEVYDANSRVANIFLGLSPHRCLFCDTQAPDLAHYRNHLAWGTRDVTKIYKRYRTEAKRIINSIGRDFFALYAAYITVWQIDKIAAARLLLDQLSGDE